PLPGRVRALMSPSSPLVTRCVAYRIRCGGSTMSTRSGRDRGGELSRNVPLALSVSPAYVHPVASTWGGDHGALAERPSRGRGVGHRGPRDARGTGGGAAGIGALRRASDDSAA